MKNPKKFFLLILVLFVGASSCTSKNLKKAESLFGYLVQTTPEKVCEGEKITLKYSTGKDVKDPVFNVSFLGDNFVKKYCLKATKHNNKYSASIVVPWSSYLVFYGFGELNSATPIGDNMSPIYEKNKALKHNAAMRMLSDDREIPDAEFYEILRNDSITYPQKYDRYIVRWDKIKDNSQIIKAGIRELEKEALKSNLALNDKYLIEFTKMYGYAEILDTVHLMISIDKLMAYGNTPEERRKLSDAILPVWFYTMFDSYYSKSIFSVVNKLTDYAVISGNKAIIQQLIMDCVPDANYIDYDNKHANALCKSLLNTIQEDMATGKDVEFYLNNQPYFVFLSKFMKKCKQYDLALKVLDYGVEFNKKYEKPHISKDTNDYVGMFNGSDCYLMWTMYERAKWFNKYGTKQEYVKAMEEITGHFVVTTYNKSTYTKVYCELFELRYHDNDLSGAKKALLGLNTVNKSKAMQKMPKLNELFNKQGIATVSYEKFIGANSKGGVADGEPVREVAGVVLKYDNGEVNTSDFVGDKILFIVNIDENCTYCNQAIPQLITKIQNRNKNVLILGICNYNSKQVSKEVGVNINIVSRSNPQLSKIGYDELKPNRIFIIKDKKLYIESDIIDYEYFDNVFVKQ